MCAGSAGFSPEDRAELLVVLSFDKDEAVASRASEALLLLCPEDFLPALKREDAPEALFRYCADNLAEKPGIADGMAENINCPAEMLIQVAPFLKEAVELLVNDLDRLSSTPGLVTALAPCAGLSAKSRAVLDEIQKDAPVDELELARAVESLAASEPDKDKRMSLFQRVAKMRVVERMQLGLRGNREERMLLIRDRNKLVQRAVMQSPKLTDQEVESFAGATSLSEDVLRIIAGNRKFSKNYAVVRSLMFNPKTPLDISLQMLQRLLPPDLKTLCGNKNVPETLRSTAMKLHRQRTVKKSSSG